MGGTLQVKIIKMQISLKTKTKFLVMVGILFSIYFGVFYVISHPFIVGAGPSIISDSASCYIDGLTSATNTPKWLAPGGVAATLGHTTACDITQPNNTLPSDINLVFQHAASSSPLSYLDISVQTSFDGRQWSSELIQTFTSNTATTSRTVYNPNFSSTFHQIASTTDILSGVATGTTTATIVIPNPHRARYFKVFFSVPTGSQPSNIWAMLKPITETF